MTFLDKFESMELIAASVVTACATLGVGIGRLLSERRPRTKLKQLLDLREKLDGMSMARQSIEEAIDRCALKVVHTERDRLTTFSRVLGLITAAVGFLIMLFVLIAHSPRSEETPQYVTWLAVISLLLTWVGGISLAIGTRFVSTIYPQSMFKAESREIDDRYELPKRYRHLESKRKMQVSARTRIRKRARSARHG